MVVNTVNETASASFNLRSAEQWPRAMSAALERVDGAGQAHFREGRMVVTLEALDTHVYVTDCDSQDRVVI